MLSRRNFTKLIVGAIVAPPVLLLFFLAGCGGPTKSNALKETRQRFEVIDTQELWESYGLVYITVFKDKDTNKQYLLTRTGHGLTTVEMRP